MREASFLDNSSSLGSLIHHLLPTDASLQLQTLDASPDQPVSLTLATTSPSAMCPACGQPSTRVQSRYGRTLADLAWGERAVRLFVTVRRFWCLVPTCPRRIFAERLPAVMTPYARRTTRLADTQAHTALALGGTAGARQCARQHTPVSCPTLLRMIRRLPLPALPPLRVVGVDDWAMRKGRTYGSIVVDLERHHPIDLLPDRTAETWTAWLQAHPGIRIICRDRATPYAAGSTAGAPTATQVADRWHIVQNLRTAIEDTLQQHRAVLGRTPPATPLADDAIPPAPPNTTPLSKAQAAARAARRETRYHQYQRVIELHGQGLSLGEISRQSGVSVRTIQSWLAADGFPERKARTGDTSQLNPFKLYLHERWDAGCHKATQLWRAIQAQGYAGSYRTVVGYLQPLRQGKPLHRPPATLAPAAMLAPTETRYTPRQAAFLHHAKLPFSFCVQKKSESQASSTISHRCRRLNPPLHACTA